MVTTSIVFVHGFYGSNLTDKDTGRTAWLSLYSIWKGHGDLELPLEWNSSGQQARDNLVPTSLATRFCKPWVHFCDKLEKDHAFQIKNYLWDWRRSPEETSEDFLVWVKRELDPESRPLLVTFSTGSLLGWVAVNQYPELFSGWVSVGGAVGAGNFMLEDHMKGWTVSGIRLLRAETSRSLPGTYSFFAAPGRRISAFRVATGEPGYDSLFQSKDGQPLGRDLLDVKEWKSSGLGYYSDGRTPTTEEEEHLRNCCASVKRFREKHFVGASSLSDPKLLKHHRKRYEHLKLVAFGSKSYSTHAGWVVDDDDRITLASFTKEGDGTVVEWAWNCMPGGLPFDTVYTDTVHIELMTDPKLVQLVAKILDVPAYDCAGDWKTHLGGTTGLVGGLVVAVAIATFYR